MGKEVIARWHPRLTLAWDFPENVRVCRRVLPEEGIRPDHIEVQDGLVEFPLRMLGDAGQLRVVLADRFLRAGIENPAELAIRVVAVALQAVGEPQAAQPIGQSSMFQRPCAARAGAGTGPNGV